MINSRGIRVVREAVFLPPLSLWELRTKAIVAGGYGDDMPEDQCYDLLDDMDFYYNRSEMQEERAYASSVE